VVRSEVVQKHRDCVPSGFTLKPLPLHPRAHPPKFIRLVISVAFDRLTAVAGDADLLPGSVHLAVSPAAVDLVVLTDYLVADPRLVRDLHSQGVPHLPVRVRDGTGLVGPLVIPGVTSCLGNY
jgi:hypothetical protein